MFTPVLDGIDIQGKDITGDALLTQRKLATYLVEEREAHYHFTVKGNQPTLQDDIAFLFKNRNAKPDFTSTSPPGHGRIETRRIWCSTELNDYLDFPHVGQAFLIEREVVKKKARNARWKRRWESPAVRQNRLHRSAYSKSIAATGPSKTVATTSSIGTTTRIAAVSVPTMARKMFLAYAVLPLAF